MNLLSYNMVDVASLVDGKIDAGERANFRPSVTTSSDRNADIDDVLSSKKRRH